MPHDKNGNLVEKGDRVLIEYEVESVQAAEDYCNMNIRPVIPMPGVNAWNGAITANTKQCEILKKASEE